MAGVEGMPWSPKRTPLYTKTGSSLGQGPTGKAIWTVMANLMCQLDWARGTASWLNVISWYLCVSVRAFRKEVSI